VHRSFADFGFAGFVTDRKFFFMAKDDLWKNKLLGRWLLYVGCFPVHRDSADRESLRRAEAVLKSSQVLILFPEGTRKEGPLVHELYEGPAFLSARTGAPIVPMGIGGTDLAMPKGRVLPKRMRIRVVLGEPVAPPQPGPSGRVSRTEVHRMTELLHGRIQQQYDEARAGYPYDEARQVSGGASADGPADGAA
jgi:1-acyl-sn-glycerol-3-phosphate acyltransferase